MLLVAESGSTKTKWLSKEKEYQTIGFNPLFHTSESIYTELMKQEQLLKDKDKFTKIFFYGASCSSEGRKKVVYEALEKYFPNAKVISVDHDMKAASVATFDGRKAIVCILGTGSNSCLYDGKEMQEIVPALGYVLGDEGSGAYFGKKLLALFLYHSLPDATTKIMKEKYGLEKEKIIASVYQKPFANVYLSGFAKIMSETPDKEFFQYHVCCYENY